jgi:ATP-dependent Clp protease ATP-binding subunit ClpC
MIERLSEKALEAIQGAKDVAKTCGALEIGTVHIVISLWSTQGSDAAHILNDTGILPEQATAFANEGPVRNTVGVGPVLSTGAKFLLETTVGLVDRPEKVTPEQLLLVALTDDEVVTMCHNLGMNREQVIQILSDVVARRVRVTANEGLAVPTGESILEQLGQNLTQKAADGDLDPVIGRDTEIHQMVVTLCHRRKPNPLLIGEAGVGKTALAEGLAQRIADDEVPAKLHGFQIWNVDISGAVAGTSFRGEFEEKLQKLVAEVKERGNVILFLDEIHTLVGAGATSSGAMDASNILKPELARGDFRVIGATTVEEYSKHFEKDAALNRRFRTITVEEPTAAVAKQIVAGLAAKYADHHGVIYSPEALDATVAMSVRYLTDRQLPDKAIDLMDTAGATVSCEVATGQTRDAVLIDAEHVATVVAAMTGVPVMSLTDSDKERLLKMEDEISARVVGQESAVKAVSASVRRTHAGVRDPNRPGGSFIFAGPTGVGKTELSKALAEFMFGDEESLLCIDMSEYGEKHTVSKLLGAPPGYVGYDEGGQLTEKVRRKPYSVVLLDEVEKAHPDVFNSLLQVLEEGRMTDGRGRVVDFTNTIIIMTTNLGSRAVAQTSSLGFGDSNATSVATRRKADVSKALTEFFRPEFLNRVDDIVTFDSLTRDNISDIVELLVGRLNARLLSQQVSLSLSVGAKATLAEVGYDPTLGARPLRRAVTRLLEDPLSERILFGQVNTGDNVVVDVDADGEFTFTV